MKATNKHEFFELLGTELNRIGIEDTADIFADFEEHFSDSAMQGIPEDVTAERLGDIKEIARSYLNLESSRINSIMARDVEHRKVSLTKPGRAVPADLSLLDNSAADAINSDNIREYTPQHFSGEIYPNNANNSNRANNSGSFSNAAGSSTGYSGNASSSAGSAASASANPNKSVADAFSEAGRAAVDAAKITGHAVADAFKQSAVKDAVVGAGKTAADAVKAATHSAAEAINKATAKHEAKKQGSSTVYNSVPRPTDSYRENMNTTGTQHTDSFRANDTSASHQGTIPPQGKKAKAKQGFKFISTKDLKTNVNPTKLLTAILLDVFLWSWLVPMIFSLIIGLGISGIGVLINEFFGSFGNYGYNIISRFFRAGIFGSAAVMAVCVGWWIIKLPIKLVVYIINMHIKAVYDL